MAESKRAEVLSNLSEKAASGEKVKAPRDLFGALVASQIDLEKGTQPSSLPGLSVVGLHSSEVVGNICELLLSARHYIEKALVTFFV